MRVASIAKLAGAALLPQLLAAQSCGSTLEPDYPSPIVADGWDYRIVANGFNRPRSLLFDTNGALLLLDAGHGVRHLTLEDGNGTCLQVRSEKTIIHASELNHGLALLDDGQVLYASSSDKVFSWSYDADQGDVENTNRTIVQGMDNSGHSTRTLLLSKKSPNMLVVSRGSQGNFDELCLDESSGHCQVRAFNLSALENGEARPYNFTTNGIRLGWGLRNSVGLAEHPDDGGIWTVENSVDNVEREGRDIHQDNPGEELNFHGNLSQAMSSSGANYGYPTCLAVWSLEDFPSPGSLTTGAQFDASGDDTVDDARCQANYLSPRLTFQAHTAPLDIIFTPNGSDALVAFHGSWNRDEPAGYKLSSIEFAAGSPVADADSKTALNDILTNNNVNDCPDNCFRPVGLTSDIRGRIFMTSDTTGEIFVLVRTGDSTSESSPSPSQSPTEDESAAAAPLTSGIMWTLPLIASSVVALRMT